MAFHWQLTRRSGSRWLRIAVFGWLFAVGHCGDAPAVAAEPVAAFVARLHERDYHDTTLDYLDWLAERKPDGDWQRLAPYYRGRALIKLAAEKSGSETATAQLQQAETLLREFVTGHGDTPEAKLSEFWLARLLADQARAELKTVTEDMTGPAKRKIRGPAAEKFSTAQEQIRRAGRVLRAGQLTAMRSNCLQHNWPACQTRPVPCLLPGSRS